MGGIRSHTDNLFFHQNITECLRECALNCSFPCMCTVQEPVNTVMLSMRVFTIMHAGVSVDTFLVLSQCGLGWYTEVNLKRMSRNPHRTVRAVYYY